MTPRDRRSANAAPRRVARWLMAVLPLFPAASDVLARDPIAVTDVRNELVQQALAYEHGEGVPKDPLEAAAIYCRAARELDAEAQFSLGWMYANGRGVPRDEGAAAALFASAAAFGHIHAEKALTFVAGAPRRMPECMASEGPFHLRAIPEFHFVELEEYAGPDPFESLPPWKRQIAEIAVKLAPQYAIDKRLALAVIAVESNFLWDARSHKGAAGLMQLIPETASRFKVKRVYDVADNLRGGLAYLQWLLAYYQGNVPLAVAAYNAGEKAVDKYGGIPPFPETRSYVGRVLRLYGSEKHPYVSYVVGPSPALTLAEPRRP